MMLYSSIMASPVVYLTLALFVAVSAAPQTRIAGGDPITINEFPYVVALTYYYQGPGIFIQRCVGGLLSSWHVVTTAYCYYGANIENMRIRAGSTQSLSGGVEVTVSQYIAHPDYQASPRTADIAITFVSELIFLTSVIDILQVPYQNFPIADGTAAQVVSWGFNEEGTQSPTLQSMIVNKINTAECQRIYADKDNVLIDDRVICASAPGVGICNGDSGAPMSIGGVVVGISSTYQECGSDGYPDVYTRVDQFSNWIMEVAVAP